MQPYSAALPRFGQDPIPKTVLDDIPALARGTGCDPKKQERKPDVDYASA